MDQPLTSFLSRFIFGREDGNDFRLSVIIVALSVGTRSSDDCGQ